MLAVITVLAIIGALFDLLIGVDPLLNIGGWLIGMCCASAGFDLGRRSK